MSPAEALLLTIYYLVLGSLTTYGLHRLYLVRLRRRVPAPARLQSTELPSVTVQLPLFNEPNVAARLLDAVAALSYGGPLHIQVLDDSTDETSGIVAARVAAMRSAGLSVDHVRRASRQGYKAGALAAGLEKSDSALLAVFDADFVPPPDVLMRMVPYFADPSVGMVQARWAHLNRARSLLTRVQALFLDAHFAIESSARSSAGRFFNFNGTAGIWRRSAIEEAGGWSASTLTEDLDLSYRAQLAGWRFVFLDDVEVHAELPAALSGFQQQQHRWAKGSIQTARKLLLPLLRSEILPWRVKLEAFFHLTNNLAYLLTLLLAMLIVPAVAIRHARELQWTFVIDFLLFAISTGSVLLFYIEGQRRIGRPRPRLLELLTVLPIGVGMSMRNASAVVEGLVAGGGHFARTPKEGSERKRGSTRGETPPRLPIAEAALTVFFAAAIIGFVTAGQWISTPFVMLFAAGYGYVSFNGVSERLSHWKQRA